MPSDCTIIDRRVVIIGDYKESNFDRIPTNANSALAIPVQFGEQPVGVIHVYSDRVDAFTPRSVEFLLALANQAGIAFGNAARFRQQGESGLFDHRRSNGPAKIDRAYRESPPTQFDHRVSSTLEALTIIESEHEKS